MSTSLLSIMLKFFRSIISPPFIELIITRKDSFNIDHLAGKIDFCLLAFVVHEIPDQQMLFKEVFKTLKPNARVLYMEPKGPAKEQDWYQSLEIAKTSGFWVKELINLKGSRACELINKR